MKKLLLRILITSVFISGAIVPYLLVSFILYIIGYALFEIYDRTI